MVRILALVLGTMYWMYLKVPRFDVERRCSSRYRTALRRVRKIWIGSCSLMLFLIGAFPGGAASICLALTLLTSFLSYMILDEIE